ncbi:hypothetical protein Cni_G29246 [Canna indica]|uniref:Non-haem dioxygenase N-terminal domain-containing protein n=1 Tax=Canna indica TaxID=4628 RepID=A0AAQ3L8S3_9LILI|nr:hypothetical protein Cni_G29246 [Canna indica]
MVTFAAQRLPSLDALFLPLRFPSSRRSPLRVSMAIEPAGAVRTARTITISYSDIKNKDKDLSMKIEEGFGPNGLGVISLSDVPGFPLLRQNLLHLAPRVAKLPDDVKTELEDPESRFNFGWSHGKEKLESGKLDLFKGSFYANPILDSPTTDLAAMHRYPSYCRPNKWPTTSLAELEVAFKALGKMMLDVGLMLAYHCDQYVAKEMKDQNAGNLEQFLKRSRCHKGRLLYYFPRDPSQCENNASSISSWCGWHNDHGSLTGLTCGMFTKNGVEIPSPDSAAGLYVKTRNDQIVKVVLEEDELAFQIGETTEILAGGCLCATPHCVQASNSEKAVGVGRSTFALFMQPDWDEKLSFPGEIRHHQELISPNETLTFGEFSEKLLNKYYNEKS